jgi:hypothetical protein
LGRYVICGTEDTFADRFSLADGARTPLAGGHESWVFSVAVSGDGAWTVTGGGDGRLVWWETAAEAPRPVRAVEAHAGWIRSLAVSPDGQSLASGGNDGFVRIWNLADGSLLREIAGHARNVYSVAYHPDGALLSGDLLGVLKQWDPATGREVRTFDAATLHSYNAGQAVDFGGVRGLGASLDGAFLAAGGLHKASNPLGAVHEPLVLIFGWEKGELLKSQIPEGIAQGVVWDLAWLADGTLCAASGGGTGGLLLFFKPEEDKDFHRLMLPNIVRHMALSADGRRVATAHHDGKVRLTRLGPKAG